MVDDGHRALMWVTVVVMVAVGVDGAATGSLPPFGPSHRVVMDPWSQYIMMWSPKEFDVIFEVQVATRGYVGLGFSPTGSMKKADIILGWVDDSGQVFLHDRNVDGYDIPSIDESQDVQLLGGYQNGTHTVLRFSRPWTTCDNDNDYQLTEDTTKVIWALSYSDPTSETVMSIHDERGVINLLLTEHDMAVPSLGSDVKNWDIIAPSVEVSDKIDTMYWCKLHKIPETPGKAQVVGYVPVIEQKNARYVHHILIYECHMPDSPRHYEKWLRVKGHQCYGPNMPLSWFRCTSLIAAWAIGAMGEMFPDNVGVPMGEEHGGATYFMMEIHYDNPALHSGVVDSSGIRMLYTETPRQYDAALMTVGHAVVPFEIIPPKRKWLTKSVCHGSCTRVMFPEGGIHIFRVALHSHLLGDSLIVRHIRDGQELEPIMEDAAYDFNFQQSRRLRKERTVLPGDSFIVECDYDATKKNRTTFGGFGTEDEMCLAFLMYYPRVKLGTCTSMPHPAEIMGALGVEDIYKSDVFLGVGQELKAIDEQAEIRAADASLNGGDEGSLQKLSMSHLLYKMVAKGPRKFLNKTMYSILNDPATMEDNEVMTKLQEKIQGLTLTKCLSRQGIIQEVSKAIPFPTYTPLVPQPKPCIASSN